MIGLRKEDFLNKDRDFWASRTAMWGGVGLVMVVVSYLWMDIPIVHWTCAHDSRSVKALLWATLIPEVLVWVMRGGVVVTGVAWITGNIKYPWVRLWAAMGWSTIASEIITLLLKIALGRSWPETWIHGNPSLLRNGVYGFQWFRGVDIAFRSFPSAHMAAIVGGLTPLWVVSRRWRPAIAVSITLVAIGLLGMYFHFLSDVLAGGLIGCFTGIAFASWFKTEAASLRNP